MADSLRLTETQAKILEALCRPCIGESRFSPPATNQEIADELFLSVDAIKAHLRVLYKKFGVEPLAHNQKRARLVELALERGVVGSGGVVGAEPEADAEGDVPTDSDTGRAADTADAAGHSAIAVPVDSPAAGNALPQTPRKVPRLGGSSMLISAGVILGAIVIGVIAIVVLTGGSDGSESDTTRDEYSSIVKRSCTQSISQGETYSQSTRVKRAIAYQQTFSLVGESLGSVEPPAGEDPGLVQFTKGIEDATELNRQLSSTAADANATELATIAAKLTIAAGNIQAGAIRYALGEDCGALGSIAGESAQNATGPA